MVKVLDEYSAADHNDYCRLLKVLDLQGKHWSWMNIMDSTDAPKQSANLMAA